MEQREQISAEERAEINDKILAGAVYRASSLLFVWAAIVTFYGFISLDLMHLIDPNITVWQNVWPRLTFNALPMLIIGYFFRDSTKHTLIKAYTTVILLPGMLVAASMVYAWPAIFSGHEDLYLYFHATNVIAMASAMAIVSGTPRLIVFQALGFILIYFGPLLYLFSGKFKLLANMVAGDVFMISVILYVGLRSIYKIRFRLAVEDLLKRRKLTPFIGKNLAKAIFETREMNLEDHTQDGLILAVDLRGYTSFLQNTPAQEVKRFINEYHRVVSGVLGENNAYLHKTNGDGLLISFGVMDKEIDLSDVPGIESDRAAAETKRRTEQVRLAFKAFAGIVSEFEEVKKRLNVKTNIVVGAGIAAGTIDVLVRGDQKFRQELDIDGAAIVKAVRLEAYSKLLNKMIDPDSSFLVAAPDLADHVDKSYGFKLWLSNTEGTRVRDFPDIQSILYRQWKHNRVRNTPEAA